MLDYQTGQLLFRLSHKGDLFEFFRHHIAGAIMELQVTVGRVDDNKDSPFSTVCPLCS